MGAAPEQYQEQYQVWPKTNTTKKQQKEQQKSDLFKMQEMNDSMQNKQNTSKHISFFKKDTGIHKHMEIYQMSCHKINKGNKKLKH